MHHDATHASDLRAAVPASALPVADPRPVEVLSPGAAVGAWLCVLVALTVTVHPLVAGGAFAGLAALACVSGHRRLLLVALLVGAGALAVIPGVSLAAGGWELTFGPTADWLPRATPGGLAMALLSVLRVPAQVLGVVLLALVAGWRLLGSLARLSPDAALLAGLAARARPLLARDAALLSESLRARGQGMARGAPVGQRAAGAVRLWESLVAGAFDRALATAAVLHSRGYSEAGRPTGTPLRDARLVAPVAGSRRLDVAVLSAGVALLAAVVAGRATGQLGPPLVQVFSGVHEPVTPLALLAAGCAMLVGLLPAIALQRPSAAAAPQPAAGMGMIAVATEEPHVVAGLRAGGGGGTVGGPLVVVRGLRVRHPGVAQPSLSLDELVVHAGELVVLTGPSGSGKSTLVDVLSGVAPGLTGGAVSGTVQHAGTGAGRVAAVFQDSERQVVLDGVADDVALALRLAGLPVEDIERRVLAALDEVGCLHLARRACSTLSGGELQRVLVAAALARRAPLLVLDEPVAQLDAAGARLVWTALDAARARGAGVLVAEHRLEGALPIEHRVVALGAGSPVTRGGGVLVGIRVPQPAASPVARLAMRGFSTWVPARSGMRAVVRGLDLDLAPGAVLAVTGPNGSGKSTMLRALRGLHPSGGVVLVDGRRCPPVEEGAALWGYSGQRDSALVLAADLVAHAVHGRRASAWLVAAARTDLLAAGLGDRLHSHPADLSLGERQRLAVVSATVHRPPVWLLDEPTRAMDDRARRWLAMRVAAHASAGGTVVLATHDDELVAALATHVLVLGRERVASPAGRARVTGVRV